MRLIKRSGKSEDPLMFSTSEADDRASAMYEIDRSSLEHQTVHRRGIDELCLSLYRLQKSKRERLLASVGAKESNAAAMKLCLLLRRFIEFVARVSLIKV